METTKVTRRDFLQTVTVAGVASLASAEVFGQVKAETASPVKKSIFICPVCGHIEFGKAPEACPICHSPKDSFTRNDSLFSDTASKFSKATDKHVPVVKASKKSALVTEVPSIAVNAKIGSVIHPMEEVHHIKFIDCYIDDAYTCRLLLTLRNHPTFGTDIKTMGSKVRIVTLCTLHGYWQSEVTVA